ncbi:MAG: VWA domain-containing protein, partial [Saprospiraceae bacterium]|nr:VWA domain-containing protein [Saprospiraceae bacterium]
LMQRDALEKLDLDQLLLEPELLETLEPDPELVGTLLSLKKVLPAKTKETARELVRKVVQELEKQLRLPMEKALRGSLHRAERTRRPKFNEIDWHQTIRTNLKHYQESLQTIIPELLIGHGRKRQQMKQVIILIDQSGSMATSMVYASVFGAIMASVSSLKTSLIVFDTSVVDLTEHLDDPVELLFAAQLGGGTDINRALAYAQNQIESPLDTVLVLISDLFEGGLEEELLKRSATIKASGVNFISLLALNDKGAPAYNHKIAGYYGQLEIPSFACTPDQFPDLMAAAIQKEDLSRFQSTSTI